MSFACQVLRVASLVRKFRPFCCKGMAAPAHEVPSTNPDPLAPERLNEMIAEFKRGFTCDHTEKRAITLKQLIRVRAFIKKSCNSWRGSRDVDWETKKPLEVEHLNLYHLNYWLIMPATKADNCSMVECLGEHEQIPHWFISHWWGEVH